MPSTVTDRVDLVSGGIDPPTATVLPPGGGSPTLVTERVPGYGSGTGIPSSSLVAADRTALSLIDPTDFGICFLLESGYQGWFQWNSGNLSAQVTLDPGQGTYVAPSSDATGASGAWERVALTYFEPRTSDPASPIIGRAWLRTDL